MTRLSDIQVHETPPDRSDLRFTYTLDELIKAAQRQAEFHEDRAEDLALETDQLEESLRSKGIQLREHPVTGGTQFSAVVDQEVAQAHADARARRERHLRAGRMFRAWEGAFKHDAEVVGNSTRISASPTAKATVKISVEDIDYFALYRDAGD